MGAPRSLHEIARGLQRRGAHALLQDPVRAPIAAHRAGDLLPTGARGIPPRPSGLFLLGARTLIKRVIRSRYAVGARTFIQHVIRLSEQTMYKLLSADPPYDQDGLRSFHNHEFMRDPSFRKAYERGVTATGTDYQWHWRVHVSLWAAYSASKLKGDFIECGVNRGFLSSAIIEYLNWDSLNKTFYLMDTFSGLDERYLTDEERHRGRLRDNARFLQSGFYTTDMNSVRENFSQWKNVQIVVGPIPDTLDAVKTEHVAYLHLDMNCALPEVAAFKYFWDRLVPGAFVLLDDYGQREYAPQKAAIDEAAATKDVKVVSLPTGQGLVIKPA